MKRHTALLLTLGLLTALAPVVNNMFSPAMPDMVAAFDTKQSMVQLGLTACMLGLALGQVLFGPLSDRMGRRRPLLCSMVLLTLVSMACALAPSAIMLVTLRALQGLAAGGGIVIARSVATDVCQGNRLIQALAFINVFNGLMPIVTPMLGSALNSLVGWQGPLWGMMAVAVILLAACAFLPETLPVGQRVTLNWAETAGLFGKVLRNRPCIFTILHQGCALAILFGNIALTPFLVILYGREPATIGYALGINGIFTALGAGAAAGLGDARRGMRITAIGLPMSCAVMTAVLLGNWGFWLYEAVVSVMLFFVGVTLTSSSGQAMECARAEAGTASAMLGAVGFVVGAVTAPLVTLGNLLTSSALVYLVAALLTSLFTHLAFSQQKSTCHKP